MRNSSIAHQTTFSPRGQRSGFTLIEFLVVIAICAILIAMAVPAVLASRESARRAACAQHIRQLYLAVNSYNDAHGTFPAGVISLVDPVPPETDGNFRSWMIPMLPFLDQPVLDQKFASVSDITTPAAKELRQYRIGTFLCPSDTAPAFSDGANHYAQSNYAGCHDSRATSIADGNNGLMTLNQRFSSEDIPDGTCCTFLGGEFRRAPTDLGWASGTRGTLRNTGTPINRTFDGRQSELQAQPLPANPNSELSKVFENLPSTDPTAELSTEDQPERKPEVVLPARAHGDPGGFGSYHPGGAFLLMADGQVRMISQSIDDKVYQLLGSRMDGSLVGPGSF